MKSKISATLFANWFQRYLLYSLFIAYENDGLCHFVVHIAIDSPSVISFYCVCFVSFYFFIFFFREFYYLLRYWGNPANICLDEDVLKTSFVFVFRRRLQDVLIKTNMFALALRLQKTSSRRLQDVLVKTNIFVLAICLQDIFKMSSRRL